MNILSFRKISLLEDEHVSLKSLEQQKRDIDNKIKFYNQKLKTCQGKERLVAEEILKELQIDYMLLKQKINETNSHYFILEDEIDKYGFSLRKHLEERFNQRFSIKELNGQNATREDILEFFSSHNLKDKIPGTGVHNRVFVTNTDEGGMYVSVDDYIVMTALTDEAFYEKWHDTKKVTVSIYASRRVGMNRISFRQEDEQQVIKRLRSLQTIHDNRLDQMGKELVSKFHGKEISDRFWDALPADLRNKYKDPISSIREKIRDILVMYPGYYKNYQQQNRPFFQKMDKQRKQREDMLKSMGEKPFEHEMEGVVA